MLPANGHTICTRSYAPLEKSMAMNSEEGCTRRQVARSGMHLGGSAECFGEKAI